MGESGKGVSEDPRRALCTQPSLPFPGLARVSMAVKRHYGHSNFYKGKVLIGAATVSGV